MPDGLKSTAASLQLKFKLTNMRSDAIKVYWVDYNGNAVFYGLVPASTNVRQGTYGTHPWLITTASDKLLFYFVPMLSDLEITVK